VNFGSDPGRDDGGLPPVNIVIPDDARELERDVLAYRRELRAARRRDRLLRLVRPWRARGFAGHAAILPLIATCVALSMLAGAMLSVVTISPASAPTVTKPPAPAPSPPVSLLPALRPASQRALPAGTLRIGAKDEPLRGLARSALALVTANCSCGTQLKRLAGQAKAAHVGVYFVGEGQASFPRIPALARKDGDGTAVAATDTRDVLADVYHPSGLTVLLVYGNATSVDHRNLPANFDLTPALRALALPRAGG
jgi:hypothetical protein